MHLNQARSAFEHWLVHHNDLSPHSVRAYTSDVAAFERYAGGTFDVTTLTEVEIRMFLESMVASGLSSTSMRRRFVGVRIFASWLVEAGHLEADPSANVTVRFAKPRRLPRAISLVDVRCLLLFLCDAAGVENNGAPMPLSPHRSRLMSVTTLLAVALMIGTGMRGCELVALRVADVDLPSRSIRVLGKGRRERFVYLSNEWICQMLAAFLETRVSDEDKDWVFLNRSGQPLTTTALRARVKRAAREAGLSVPVTPHMLRHTAATQLIEAGVDIRFVQRLLGHASLTTTEIYTHIADTSLRQAITQADTLGAALIAR